MREGGTEGGSGSERVTEWGGGREMESGQTREGGMIYYYPRSSDDE